MSVPTQSPALVGDVLDRAAAPPGSVAEAYAGAVRQHGVLARAVYRMRFAGASWSQVATALGCSKSAAHERWKHLDQTGGDVEVLVDVVDGVRTARLRCSVMGVEVDALDVTPAGLRHLAAGVRRMVEAGHAA